MSSGGDDAQRETLARDTILRAAREELSECGYEGSTIRGIAKRAAVNSSLIYYYFGSKAGLLRATLDDLARLLEPPRVEGAAAGPATTAGEDLLRRVLPRWESAEYRSAVLAIIRASITRQDAGRLLDALLSPEVLGTSGGCARAPSATGACPHTIMIGAQLVGLMMLRHITPVEPVASASLDRVIALFAPVVQRHLTDHTTKPPAVS
uniref:Transcriptional regulator n=1 Tax=Streptomyces sp. CNH287 TaxID=1288082 RepID=U6A3N1_9ACTN|nr:transcriptional regulator [Streptomyces sp. CNH287]